MTSDVVRAYIYCDKQSPHNPGIYCNMVADHQGRCRALEPNTAHLLSWQPSLPAPGLVVNGDVLFDVITEAVPDVLSDRAAADIADRALALAHRAGMTILRGPDFTPWTPEGQT